MTRRFALLSVAVCAAFAAVLAYRSLASSASPPRVEARTEAPARFVGSETCASCHASEYAAWRASHHHRAMEEANRDTVLGDFDGAELRVFGHTTRFEREGAHYLVTTENARGELETFTVRYTLGVEPLQQYLVAFEDGRLQALPFAWDSRPVEAGGQRWFHLYPDEDVRPDDPLFWTRAQQNWNHMCGDCHTTDFAKGYSSATDRFASHFAELGNGCESCHGPGSTHVRANGPGTNTRGRHVDHSLVALGGQRAQIDQCGACHARRVRLREAGGRERMHDTWRPELLTEGLYFVDGQIEDEVFEIGSFLQSKMASRGVACTQCHDPHSGGLRADGNALCTQCHASDRFDTPSHHFHAEGTEGARCVSCHMPTRTYMQVHARRDHRIAVPRPDLSDTLGTPNACASCHADQGNAWAAEAIRVRSRVPSDRTDASTLDRSATQSLGVARIGMRSDPTDAAAYVQRLLDDPRVTSIAKASAVAALGSRLSPETLPPIETALRATDPFLRLGATQALVAAPLPLRASLLTSLAHDDSRAVRFEVAPLLAEVDSATLPGGAQRDLASLRTEYHGWLNENADRTGALVALSNLARGQGDDRGAETLLRRAVALHPDSADAYFALGLSAARRSAFFEAAESLARAARLAPDDAHYAYVYAVALYSTGDVRGALTVLHDGSARFPESGEIAGALRSYCAASSTDRFREICAVSPGVALPR